MSDTSDDFGEYFEDALRIHAICADSDMSDNDARLLTYMHAKANQSKRGIDYFLDPAKEDSDALEIMLGRSKGTLRIPAAMSLDDQEHEAIELILTIAERISRLDNLLAQECGMENRLSGELRMRLQLYTDSVFRNRMIHLYCDVISPRLPLYDREKVDLAFQRSRIEQQRKERELMLMVGLVVSE